MCVTICVNCLDDKYSENTKSKKNRIPIPSEQFLQVASKEIK